MSKRQQQWQKPPPASPRVKNVVSEADHAALRESYCFIPPSPKDLATSESTKESWQDRMVQNYHDHLYKEYALADLSFPGKIGLRWRTRQEVVDGRGERTCGNKHCPSGNESNSDRTTTAPYNIPLKTLEVPFSYEERGVRKKELVKLRLCPTCTPLIKTPTHQTIDAPRETNDNEEDSASTHSSSFSSSSSDHRQQQKGCKRRRREERNQRKKKRGKELRDK